MTSNFESWLELSKRLKKRDPLLRPLIESVGPPKLSPAKDHFRALIEAILSQQLAPRAAETIISRFKALEPPCPSARSICRWQTPQIQAMRKAGVSGQKASYIQSLAQHWGSPQWRRGWKDLSDEALVERLVQVKGIGDWTAQMFLIFALGRPNVLPVLDYGIRRGVQILFRLDALPLPKEIPAHVAHWEGAYSVGCWYLWRALDKKILVSA